jgi:hypothetical protein
MPYPINKTDGTQLTTLEDFRIDRNSSSLVLMGRGVVNYGRLVAENFIKLLENFSGVSAPLNPMLGQVWFHTYDATVNPPIPVNKIKVYIGGPMGNPAGWVTVGGAYNSVTPPPNPEQGDLWFKQAEHNGSGILTQSPGLYFWRCRGPNGTICGWQNVNHPAVQTTPPGNPLDSTVEPAEGTLWWMLPERQLWVYDTESGGSSNPPTVRSDGTTLVPPGWVLVGPHFQKGTQTRVEQATVRDTNGATVNVLKVFSDNRMIGVFANNPFTPQTPGIDFPGFGTYRSNNTNTNNEFDTPAQFRRGLNLNMAEGAKLIGVAENSELLANIPPNEFLGRGVTGRLVTYPNGDITVDLGRNGNRWKDFWTQRVLAGTSTDSAVSASDIGGATNISSLTGITDNPTGFVRGTPNLVGLATIANDAVNAGRATQWATARSTTMQGDISSDSHNVDGRNNWTYTTLISSAGETKIRQWAEQEAQQEVTQLRTDINTGAICAQRLRGPNGDCSGFHFSTDHTGHIQMAGGSPGYNSATKGLNINGESNILVNLQFTEAGEIRIAQLASAVFDGDMAGNYVPLTTSSAPTGQHNMGNSGQRWGTIYSVTFDGTATRALYADLAERYHSDTSYPTGTLMVFGGANEVTQTTQELEYSVLGVVSENPAYLMNAGAGRQSTHPAIGLKGRLPVRVIGPVSKFDYLIASEIPGVAKSLNRRPEPSDIYSIVGRALEDKQDASEGLVLTAIGFK